MRLDQVVAQQLGSRTKAQDAIRAGQVLVNGIVVQKNSLMVETKDVIEIVATDPFVSRAAHKLEGAFSSFGINIEDEVVLDVGASTGGFTQVCLNRQARHVFALDVGHGQLVQSLIDHPRVTNLEGHNARLIEPSWFHLPIDFFCVDVSFISCTLILPALFALKPKHGLILIKPQFECGPRYLNKKGVLRSEKKRKEVIEQVIATCPSQYQSQWTDSPLAGRSGNLEALWYVERVG